LRACFVGRPRACFVSRGGRHAHDGTRHPTGASFPIRGHACCARRGVLSLIPSNYSTWRSLFELVFTKFGVLEHLHGAPGPVDAQWVQDDAFVTSWLYNRVSLEILCFVHHCHLTTTGV
jgi:hypothetical protein